jgi:hypothetical protein
MKMHYVKNLNKKMKTILTTILVIYLILINSCSPNTKDKSDINESLEKDTLIGFSADSNTLILDIIDELVITIPIDESDEKKAGFYDNTNLNDGPGYGISSMVFDSQFLYLLDQSHQNIKKYDINGKLITIFQSPNLNKELLSSNPKLQHISPENGALGYYNGKLYYSSSYYCCDEFNKELDLIKILEISNENLYYERQFFIYDQKIYLHYLSQYKILSLFENKIYEWDDFKNNIPEVKAFEYNTNGGKADINFKGLSYQLPIVCQPTSQQYIQTQNYYIDDNYFVYMCLDDMNFEYYTFHIISDWKSKSTLNGQK